MYFFDFLTLLGGLALFLYGMHIMGEGLTRTSGSRLEKWLSGMTASKWRGVLLGLGVTAIIQSSSATTVMVVGFVNSGMMKLTQAIGVIMGANVGTTVTAWLLSLTGINSENFLIKCLEPNSFSPVLAVIGVAFIMFAKSKKKQSIGMIMAGFAMLMFGMNTMTQAVAPLAKLPEFTSMLTAFSHPLLGLLAGTVITAIIQSSSASVGILQALCATGAVPFGTAIPIIMGQNIGTCITAILSAIGANKNAKRAALVHFYFNLIGTAIFLVLFYGVNAVIRFSFLDTAAAVTDIAVIHSAFNIGATLLLLPFSSWLEKLACLTVKDKEEETETKVLYETLEERFIETPAYAISQSKAVTDKMMDTAREGLYTALELLKEYDEKKADTVIRIEGVIDKYEDKLGTYLVKTSAGSMLDEESRRISMLLHCIGDFERISDHALNLMESAGEMKEKKVHFSDKAIQELEICTEALKSIVEMTFRAFRQEDIKAAREVEPFEEVMDYLCAELRNRHIKRLQEGRCTIEMGFILQDILTNYERVADHCSNIAVCIMKSVNSEMEFHKYLDTLKQKDEQWFWNKYTEYMNEYVLP